MSECNHNWEWYGQPQPYRGFYVFYCSLCDKVAQEEHFPEDDPD
jgi:hypothetical protein